MMNDNLCSYTCVEVERVDGRIIAVHRLACVLLAGHDGEHLSESEVHPCRQCGQPIPKDCGDICFQCNPPTRSEP